MTDDAVLLLTCAQEYEDSAYALAGTPNLELVVARRRERAAQLRALERRLAEQLLPTAARYAALCGVLEMEGTGPFGPWYVESNFLDERSTIPSIDEYADDAARHSTGGRAR